MIAFALTDVQFAPVSPFGLVIKIDSENETLTNDQWVVNIGGIAANNYSTGVQIPVSVIIFGIAGGCLRFLYYTSTKGREGKQLEEPFLETLKDLALFFLSSLLAIAVWLVLFQGGMESIFTLAAVSFTVGLVTREVVEWLNPETKENDKKVKKSPEEEHQERLRQQHHPLLDKLISTINHDDKKTNCRDRPINDKRDLELYEERKRSFF
jgi:hypothetical protein